MRDAGLGAGFLSLIFPLLFGHLPPRAVEELPAQVSEYYKDWNFLNAYSTREERMKLLSSLEALIPPSGKDSPRLSDILHRMRTIKGHVLIEDPEMIAKTFKPSPILRNLFSRTELVKVKEFLKSGDRLSVKLAVVELEPDDVLQYITRSIEDDNLRDSDPFLEFQDKEADGRLVQKTEYHDWALIDGRWMRKDGSLLLLKK